jgi:hypothetical protein
MEWKWQWGAGGIENVPEGNASKQPKLVRDSVWHQINPLQPNVFHHSHTYLFVFIIPSVTMSHNIKVLGGGWVLVVLILSKTCTIRGSSRPFFFRRHTLLDNKHCFYDENTEEELARVRLRINNIIYWVVTRHAHSECLYLAGKAN